MLMLIHHLQLDTEKPGGKRPGPATLIGIRKPIRQPPHDFVDDRGIENDLNLAMSKPPMTVARETALLGEVVETEVAEMMRCVGSV
jgi:hypothetical protein